MLTLKWLWQCSFLIAKMCFQFARNLLFTELYCRYMMDMGYPLHLIDLLAKLCDMVDLCVLKS